MGANTDHLLGRSANFYVKDEAAYKDGFGTAAQVEFAAAERVDYLSTSIDFNIDRMDRPDQKQSRSKSQERVTGKRTISWSVEAYIQTAQTSGTPPLMDSLYEAAMGGAFGTNTYALTSVNDLPTVRLMREGNGVLSEVVYGAWVEEMKISGSGGDIPKVSFSGGGTHYALTGTSTKSATGTNACTVTTGEGHNFMVGSLVTVSGQTDTTVRAIAGDVLTITGSSFTGAVIPKVPTAVVTPAAQKVTNGIAGSVSIDGVDYPVTSFEVTLKNNVKAFEDEALTEGVSDFVSGIRDVDGSVTVRARKDHVLALSRRLGYTSGSTRDFDDVPIVITIGPNGTQTDVVITCATAELLFGAIDIPESDEAMLNIPFKALSSTALTSDELTLKFNQ